MNGTVERQFEKMGARVRVHAPERLTHVVASALRVDVRRDRHGEYFDMAVDKARVALDVLDLRPRERHLLLLSRDVASGTKEKFLCGHDERHWFVAAVPGTAAASVRTAMEALKPPAVHEAQAREAVRERDRNRRRNAAFVRQGEWFFVPARDVVGNPARVLHREPIRRGAGKAHIVEYLLRSGGETVYVSPLAPNGLTEPEYKRLLSRNRNATRVRWQVMRRNAGVFAKGRVWHSDHRTITLVGWHQVLLNTESQAPAMRHVAFLD